MLVWKLALCPQVVASVGVEVHQHLQAQSVPLIMPRSGMLNPQQEGGNHSLTSPSVLFGADA